MKNGLLSPAGREAVSIGQPLQRVSQPFAAEDGTAFELVLPVEVVEHQRVRSSKAIDTISSDASLNNEHNALSWFNVSRPGCSSSCSYSCTERERHDAQDSGSRFDAVRALSNQLCIIVLLLFTRDYQLNG